MILSVLFGYPSKSQGTYDDFGKPEFRALALVRALKHKPFKGYDTWKVDGVSYRIEDTSAGRDAALAFLARVMAMDIATHYQSATIVPVPSSDHTQPGCEFTGSRLAAAIHDANPSFVANPAYTWCHAIPKASAEGGTRNPAELQPLLVRNGPEPQQPVVLIDDVATTCGHLFACARDLRDAGIDVGHAFCVAKTVWEPPENLFKIPDMDLDIDIWPVD